MRQSTNVAPIIEGIYDAALEPERWNDVVVSINNFVGGFACGLFSKNPISKWGETHFYCGADPHYIHMYAETHSQYDPLTKLPPFGQVVSIPDLVQFDEFRRGPFYQEWLRPQGCIDAANVVLEKSDSSFPVLMTVLSHKKMVDADMRQRIEAIVPHAQRAIAINKAIDLKKSEAATFASTIDAISSGIFLLGQNGRLIHANAAAHELLLADDCLRLTNGQLVACDSRFNQTLRKLFTSHEAAGARCSTALSLLTRNGDRYLCHVLPLNSSARAAVGANYKAIAALFVRKVALDLHSCSELLLRTFELTPSELRVLLAIVESSGVSATADKLGVAETTVKTHLQRVFAKTGASRQADLVKLAAGFSNPIAR
jgi:DNA-binding CsgD family transcriptional regulator